MFVCRGTLSKIKGERSEGQDKWRGKLVAVWTKDNNSTCIASRIFARCGTIEAIGYINYKGRQAYRIRRRKPKDLFERRRRKKRRVE